MSSAYERYSRNFSLMRDALSSAAAGNDEIIQSLLGKIDREQGDYESLFTNPPGYVKEPYMGLLKLERVSSDEPVPFFGSDIRSRHYLRLCLYSAMVDEQTQRPVRDELVSITEFSEKQFGEIISSIGRGETFGVTNRVIEGEDVAPYTPDCDPTKNDMSNLLDRADGRFSDIEQDIENLLEKVEQGLEGAKLKKSDVSEDLNSLDAHVNNIPSNARFRLDRIAEKYLKNIQEAALSAHIDLRCELSINQKGIE